MDLGEGPSCKKKHALVELLGDQITSESQVAVGVNTSTAHRDLVQSEVLNCSGIRLSLPFPLISAYLQVHLPQFTFNSMEISVHSKYICPFGTVV